MQNIHLILLLTCKVKWDDDIHTHPHFYKQASTCSAPKAFLVFVPHSGQSSQLQRGIKSILLIMISVQGLFNKYAPNPSLKLVCYRLQPYKITPIDTDNPSNGT